MEENFFDHTYVECEIRKRKYKALLDRGSEFAETVETNSVFDNIETLTNMVIQSNELVEEGNTEDRIGRSGEIVLDAQVTNTFVVNVQSHDFIVYLYSKKVIKLANDMMTITAQRMEHDNFPEDAYIASLVIVL